MFFFEEEIDESIIKNEGSLESRGNFSPHNLDINWTFFDVFNERSYSRWRLYFMLLISSLVLLSTYYPLLLILAFIEISICIGANSSDSEWMTEDKFYDYTLYISQVKGGDARLHIYVFVYYDRLGYVIYGLSDIGIDYCENIYDHQNFLGISNSLDYFNPLDSMTKNNKNIKNYDQKKILDHNHKYFFIYRNPNISNLSFFNFSIMNLLKKKKIIKSYDHFNYFFFNNDRSITWLEYNDVLKKIETQIKQR